MLVLTGLWMAAGGALLFLLLLLLLSCCCCRNKPPAAQHPPGELINILIGNITQISNQGRTTALNMNDGCPLRLEFTRFGQGAAITAHEMHDRAFLELFNGPGSDILSTTPMTKVHDEIR